MKKYTNTLLGIAAVIGLSAGSSAFADSIHGALENNRVANETVEAKTITSKRELTLWYVQDYVINARAAVEANNPVEPVVIAKSSTGSWQEALGNPVKL